MTSLRQNTLTSGIRSPAKLPARQALPDYITRSYLSEETPLLFKYRYLVIASHDYDNLMRVIDPINTKINQQPAAYDVHRFLISGRPLIAVRTRVPFLPLTAAIAKKARNAGVPSLLVGLDTWLHSIDRSDATSLIDLENLLYRFDEHPQLHREKYTVNLGQLNAAALGRSPSDRTKAIVAFAAAAGIATVAALGLSAPRTAFENPALPSSETPLNPQPNH